jgi:hypothetical protein
VLEPLSAALGQPIIVENRGGAGGSIGTALVSKADRARFRRRRSLRHRPERNGDLACEGHQDAAKKGSFAFASAGVGSATHLGRGTAAPRCRIQGRARTLQGRPGSSHKPDTIIRRS